MLNSNLLISLLQITVDIRSKAAKIKATSLQVLQNGILKQILTDSQQTFWDLIKLVLSTLLLTAIDNFVFIIME